MAELKRKVGDVVMLIDALVNRGFPPVATILQIGPVELKQYIVTFGDGWTRRTDEDEIKPEEY